MTVEGRIPRGGKGLRVAGGLLLGAVVLIAAFMLLKPPADTGGPDSLLVLCGGSMRTPLEAIIERYKTVSGDAITASYGSSGELCAQIQNTGKGDIYICHDPFMEWAEKQGVIDHWTPVGELQICIIVPKGNPQEIHALEDLARPGLRLGIGSEQYSTSGVIVRHLLEKLPYGDAIHANVVSESHGHQERCENVAMGHLDVGIAWSAIARMFQDRLDSIPIPKDNIDAITSATYGVSDLKHIKVMVGVTTPAKDKEAAQHFYEFATKDCADVWAQYGFVPDKA